MPNILSRPPDKITQQARGGYRQIEPEVVARVLRAPNTAKTPTMYLVACPVVPKVSHRGNDSDGEVKGGRTVGRGEPEVYFERHTTQPTLFLGVFISIVFFLSSYHTISLP